MKILFVFPNDYLANGIPTGIATLSAWLKRDGHDVDIFDWTFIKTAPLEPQAVPDETIYTPTEYTLEDLVVDDPVISLVDAFRAKLDEFQPDLVTISVMTGYYDKTMELLRSHSPSCPVVVGGIHATICPEDALSFPEVDMICVGEGELFMSELCRRMEAGSDISDIPNLGVRTQDGIRINPPQPFLSIDDLPTPDWGLFDSRHLFRPFEGDIYNGSFFTMSRGCPQKCSYCVNGSLQKSLADCGRYFRYQSPETTLRHLTALQKKFDAKWFKFADDCITLLPEKKLTELAAAIRPLGIQFGCSVRPDTVTAKKVELLQSMGCVAASVGVESGNEQLRQTVLNRFMSNDSIIEAVGLLTDAGIRISTFNMIGLPGETRENVFETIRLNKRMGVSAANVYIIYPYPGTAISERYGVHFRNEDGSSVSVEEASSYNLSAMSPDEVEGLLSTFNIYLALPEERWEEVRLAEGGTPEAIKVRHEFNKEASSLMAQKG
ncbi:B12-binding domain-containing radical SAM protein [Pseudodesulfovibrio sp.]|nr:B12-binding domain-containing radical SAM protein [Pseudodesulfovibrio sp.]